MKNTKMVAAGAMISAVCVILLLLGSVLEIGMYALPLIAGLLLVPYGEKYGAKAHVLAFAAVGIISFMLIPNVEQNLIFVGFFGWYPIVYPKLRKIRKPFQWIIKLLVFNLPVVGIEYLMIKFIAPETMGIWLWAVLLIMANLTFVVYDMLLQRVNVLLARLNKII